MSLREQIIETIGYDPAVDRRPPASWRLCWEILQSVKRHLQRRRMILVALMLLTVSCGDNHDLNRGKFVVSGKKQGPEHAFTYTVRNYERKDGAGYWGTFDVVMTDDGFQLGDELTICKVERR